MSDPTPPPTPRPSPLATDRWPYLLLSGGAGLLHGLLARLCFGLKATEGVLGVMTGSFIFLVPFSIGAISVVLMKRQGKWGWGKRIFGPIVPGWIALFCALLLAWEGLICIFLWLPLYTGLALLGGLTAELALWLLPARRNQNLTLLGLVMLPYLGAPVEQQLGLPREIRVVENSIDIDAPAAVVWQNIIRVREFKPNEHHFSWTHALGFPRPLEATLSAEGVGGVRHATFEHGVLFVETITDWEPEHRLAFAIEADTSAIPPTTLDEHVTVGGPYFDVLDGEYTIEPLADGGVRLHLRSHHRLSTRFNGYASLWTDFILADVQTYILEILRTRCETRSG